MNKVFHQTKQAFLFSLAFYILSFLLVLFQVGFAPILVSISLLLSLVWIAMVLMEIMKSPRIDNKERMLMSIFIIVFNILGGIAYFYFLRERVTGFKIIKKK